MSVVEIETQQREYIRDNLTNLAVFPSVATAPAVIDYVSDKDVI